MAIQERGLISINCTAKADETNLIVESGTPALALLLRLHI